MAAKTQKRLRHVERWLHRCPNGHEYWLPLGCTGRRCTKCDNHVTNTAQSKQCWRWC